MPKRKEVTTKRSAAGYHASENHGVGAFWIAFPLCDGGVGSGHGVAQPSIPPAKLGPILEWWHGGASCFPRCLQKVRQFIQVVACIAIGSPPNPLTQRLWQHSHAGR